ncbi:GDP-fucose synthetase [bacterium]|nr:GDP-fucose synthetase [bacterium]
MKILVTGGTGMVGSAFKNINTKHEIILVGSKDCDLVVRKSTFKMVHEIRPDSIIHLAARVGGVKGNTDYVADFYSENIRINTNILDAAYTYDIKKAVSLLSTCVYPDKAEYPLTEDQIQNGPPHKSNFGYAYAKRMLDVHSQALRQQHGCNFVTAVPNNLYGLNDNFDLENGHVIPALIRKIYEAKVQENHAVHTGVNIWGDGSPLREFTFASDMANILIHVLETYEGSAPINVGNTTEYSISDVVTLISKELDYNGIIFWDTTKPMGQLRKPSNNQRFLQLGWKSENYTSLEEGIKITCKWFKENYPNVRGTK